jgi:putative membrane protein
MTRFLLASAVLALSACGGTAPDETANSTTNLEIGEPEAEANLAGPQEAPVAGTEYVAKAAASDAYEIASGKLAQDKAQRAEVKSFAQMLVTDHTKSTADLKTAATSVPGARVDPAMDAEQTANMRALEAAGATDFDRLFLDQQIAAHQKALSLVQGYAQNGDTPALKSHASTVATPIQQHLQRAQELRTAASQ